MFCPCWYIIIFDHFWSNQYIIECKVIFLGHVVENWPRCNNVYFACLQTSVEVVKVLPTLSEMQKVPHRSVFEFKVMFCPY